MGKTRKYYEQLFASYPDVVTLPEFRRMLGGIGDGTARKLLRENRAQHFYIRDTYLIPKVWVIDYILSDHYNKYKAALKVQIQLGFYIKCILRKQSIECLISNRIDYFYQYQ